MFNQFKIAGVSFEVMDVVTIGVTAATLWLTAAVFKRTLFGVSVRGAAEDFDAARLMGVRANRVISGAFAFAGLLAGVAACLILMRTPAAEPNMGSEWLLKAVIAAVIGGLGSFSGAVVGGIVLGLLETLTRCVPAVGLRGLRQVLDRGGVHHHRRVLRGAARWHLQGLPRGARVMSSVLQRTARSMVGSARS